MIGILIPITWKKNNYNFFLIIINWLTKEVYYELIKITINAPSLAKVIIDVVVWHYSLLDLVMTNKSFLFILKFWLFLCYFFGIKCWLSTTFCLQINGQTKKQNNSIEVYLKIFVYFEQSK